MVFEVFGALLGAFIQGIIISIYGSTVNCDSTTLSSKITSSYMNSTGNYNNISHKLSDSSTNILVILIKYL